jgi:hypothetical protein
MKQLVPDTNPSELKIVDRGASYEVDYEALTGLSLMRVP